MVPRESDFLDDGDPYGRIFDYCQRAEELGFDFATFTHHRFSPDRPFLSSPFVLMSAVAARTSRLKLVTTIFVLPLYHPLDVAEAVASLDHLSNGRVVFGVGTGYRPYEAAAVGVPFDRRVSRMRESIEILRDVWTTEEASFHGEHFDFDKVNVVPKPVQDPHPPIWIGALEDKPVERAGRIGDGWIAPAMQTLDTLEVKARRYRAVAAEAGRASVVCLERDAAISLDGDVARAAWLERNLALARHYQDNGAALPDFPTVDPTGMDLDERYRTFGNRRGVAGSPEDCTEQLRQCEATLRCEYLSLMNMGIGPSYGHPGSYDSELAGLELFGREVLPALER